MQSSVKTGQQLYIMMQLYIHIYRGWLGRQPSTQPTKYTMVSYGLVGVLDSRYTLALLHHCRICHTATHTHGGVAQLR